jgi:hypothetical protein
MDRQLDIDILKGCIIDHYDVEEQSITVQTRNGGLYHIQLEDEGAGGNDSHAYFSEVDLKPVIGKRITKAWHEDESRDGVRLVLQAGVATAIVQVIHQNNGYYGFSYEVIVARPEQKDDLPPPQSLDF